MFWIWTREPWGVSQVKQAQDIEPDGENEHSLALDVALLESHVIQSRPSAERSRSSAFKGPMGGSVFCGDDWVNAGLVDKQTSDAAQHKNTAARQCVLIACVRGDGSTSALCVEDNANNSNDTSSATTLPNGASITNLFEDSPRRNLVFLCDIIMWCGNLFMLTQPVIHGLN